MRYCYNIIILVMINYCYAGDARRSTHECSDQRGHSELKLIRSLGEVALLPSIFQRSNDFKIRLEIRNYIKI
ncbi:MAG: Unknown protein [uncultured Aureispira sp.]|uniref:Uncharacterized protein n=1 Tax=uncultured Aureispira sp. TaxID=1331704 RepID=A0A6S6RTT6_9BACT|nr:MAG: Unknown protein [uncultured Aureispira sp.]